MSDAKQKMVSDPEVKAMAGVVRLLDGLDPSARERVVKYLHGRYCCITSFPRELAQEYVGTLQPYDGGCF